VLRRRAESTKEVEVRRAILDIGLRPEPSGDRLFMELGLGDNGFVRPGELLVNCFGFELEEVLPLVICRTDLLVWRNGQRFTPFEVDQ
jgi:hypothetical protein